VLFQLPPRIGIRHYVATPQCYAADFNQPPIIFPISVS
jgi:hypothetical protein